MMWASPVPSRDSGVRKYAHRLSRPHMSTVGTCLCQNRTPDIAKIPVDQQILLPERSFAWVHPMPHQKCNCTLCRLFYRLSWSLPPFLDIWTFISIIPNRHLNACPNEKIYI